MAELRWNPLLKEWVMIASLRQNRPQMPKNWCPFCPGSGSVPDNYEVYKYDNDFPVLSQNPSEPDLASTKLYKVEDVYGKCEVILYSPNHNITLPELSVEHIKKLVDLWTDRFAELQQDKKIKYIFIFENRGEIVGVTMPHPHGQIYGYPFIPGKIEQETRASKEHYDNTNKCLLCDLLEEEKSFDKRIIFENDDFLVYLPFYCEYPYGIYLASKAHKQNLTQFNESEKLNLAKALKEATGTLDSLFGYAFPYMMCMYQNPVNVEDCSDYSHFHIKFFPPMRSAEKVKFNASSETGAGAHCNPTVPEEKAEELRVAYRKFLSI